MKKIISLVLLASCCSLINAGCGCGRPKPPSPKPTVKQPQSKVQSARDIDQEVKCGCSRPKPKLPRK